MTDINVGDAVRVFVTFYDKPATDPARQAGDPTTVTLTVRKPNGTVESVTPIHTSAGNYEATLVADQAGRWRARWLGTGGILTSEAEESYFDVKPNTVDDPA